MTFGFAVNLINNYAKNKFRGNMLANMDSGVKSIV